MTLLGLFLRCLNAEYINTGEDGDYAVEEAGGVIFLFFQWSRGRRDWKNNLSFPAKPYRRMEDLWFCHSGFLRVWKSMRDVIENQITAILTRTRIDRIVCVGYSHGAALAALATEDMAFWYDDSQSVRGLGFGCPRVFWGPLPDSVKKRLDNFTVIRNVPDIVTHVPPAVLGYRHAGSILEIGTGKDYSPVAAHSTEAYIESMMSMNGFI